MTASELAARVEAGSGEDRQLLAEIAIAIGNITLPEGNEGPAFYQGQFIGREGQWDDIIPEWLTSLDAVVALIEEKLPDCLWDLDRSGDCRLWPLWVAGIEDGQVASQPLNREPARGLLSSFLRALAAQQQDRQTEGDSSNG